MELTERGSRFLLGLMAVLGALAFLVVRPFVQYVVLALVVGFLMRNLQAGLVARLKRPRLAASLLVALVLALLVLPLAFLVSALADEGAVLFTFVQNGAPVDRLRDFFAAWGLPEALVERAVALLTSGVQTIAAAWAQRALPSLFEFFIGLFTFFFLLFYTLVQGRELVEFLHRAVPLTRERMDRLLRESARAVDAVFKGEILVALVQGAVSGIGWWLFGYPDPILWGFAATVLSIIPWTGAALVIVPFGVWSILEGDVVRGVAFILFGVALVGSIDNVLRPLLIGRVGAIHPALVLVGVVGGLAAFGLAGLFLGPLVLVLLRAVVVVWTQDAPEPAPAR